ncbi:MAG: DNA polymerase, partial [bacterium]
VKIDRDKLNRFSKEIERELGSIQRTIYALAGREFNINSPKQLAEVLFHEIGLTPVKKTKTSYSTDTSVLEELSNVHELPRETLNYRSLSKLKNTYIDVLPGLIHPETGRLHTAFNQTVTATGRLSSSDPNLQNIPIRGEWGRKIRDAFIAEEGNLLVSADYSQIELRVLAHLSGDERLIEAFRNNVDIHSTTAAEIFSVEPSAVNPEMRRIAKTVNFGIIYGITPFGLSETLKCSPEEARKYIDRYFSLHQGVKSFIEETLVSVRNRGFSQTLFGRKRPIPDITNRNVSQRSQAERMAMNSPIQGTAADIIKIAMIQVANRFTSESISATMILQVHDELLVECEKDAVDRTQAVLKDSMEKAAQLRVPLKVEMGHGRTWAEAHV